MENTPSPSSDSGTGAISALVSIVSFFASFLNAPHVWLQNITLIISLAAGTTALISWAKSNKSKK